MNKTLKASADDYEKRVGYQSDKHLIDYFSKLRKGLFVLDVGCGHGRNAIDIKNMGHRIVGLDYNRFAIDKARQKDNELDLVVADSRDIPFGDCRFDAVISIGLLQQLNDSAEVEDAVFEISRVLKNGGLLYLSCFSNHVKKPKPPHLYTNRSFLVEVLRKNKLDVLECFHDYTQKNWFGMHYFVCKRL